MNALAVCLSKNLHAEIAAPFQSDASRGLLLAGQGVVHGAGILPGVMLDWPPCLLRTAALWPLVLVKDRCVVHAMTVERR